MCFVFIWEQTATCATYSINWLVFITEMKSVYCAVRTGSLNKAVCASSFMLLRCYNRVSAIDWLPHISASQIHNLRLISDLRRSVNEIFALLRCYAASTITSNLRFLIFLWSACSPRLVLRSGQMHAHSISKRSVFQSCTSVQTVHRVASAAKLNISVCFTEN